MNRSRSRMRWSLALTAVIATTGRVGANPNDPGILEPSLTATTGVEVRIPNTDQADGETQLNIVGPIVEVDAAGAFETQSAFHRDEPAF